MKEMVNRNGASTAKTAQAAGKKERKIAFTYAVASKKLNVKPSTIRYMVYIGKIKAIKRPGFRPLIPLDEIKRIQGGYEIHSEE